MKWERPLRPKALPSAYVINLARVMDPTETIASWTITPTAGDAGWGVTVGTNAPYAPSVLERTKLQIYLSVALTYQNMPEFKHGRDVDIVFNVLTNSVPPKQIDLRATVRVVNV